MTTEQLGDHPSPRPRADLSSSFGPPNRASSLSGRLARAPRPGTAPMSPLLDPAADAPAHPLPASPVAERTAGEKAPLQPNPTSQDTEPEAPLLTPAIEPAPFQNRSRAA